MARQVSIFRHKMRSACVSLSSGVSFYLVCAHFSIENVKGASSATGATGNSRLIELSLQARSAGLPAHNQTIIQLTSAAPGIPVTSSAQQLRNCETVINPQSVDFRLFTLECNKARPCVFVRQWKYQQTGPVQSAAVTLPVACVTSRVFC